MIFRVSVYDIDGNELGSVKLAGIELAVTFAQRVTSIGKLTCRVWGDVAGTGWRLLGVFVEGHEIEERTS